MDHLFGSAALRPALRSRSARTGCSGGGGGHGKHATKGRENEQSGQWNRSERQGKEPHVHPTAWLQPKEMIQPCPLHLHAISLVALRSPPQAHPAPVVDELDLNAPRRIACANPRGPGSKRCWHPIRSVPVEGPHGSRRGGRQIGNRSATKEMACR